MDVVIMFGVIVLIIGAIMILIEVFRMNILWGIACLLINPISIIFMIFNWDVSKKPFLIQLSGVFIVFLGAVLQST